MTVTGVQSGPNIICIIINAFLYNYITSLKNLLSQIYEYVSNSLLNNKNIYNSAIADPKPGASSCK